MPPSVSHVSLKDLILVVMCCVEHWEHPERPEEKLLLMIFIINSLFYHFYLLLRGLSHVRGC